MNRISAVIITYNEERNIARSITSLKNVADEVVVIDSFSTDNTVAIAEGLGAKVYQYAFKGYGEQKNNAINHAQYDWILNIDADEALSAQLEASLLDAKNAPKFDAYQFNILPNYCGKWIRHCGWYPAPKVRFWNKLKASMSNDKVHESLALNDSSAKIGFLHGDLFHYSYHTISDHIRKIETYSEIGARFDVQRGKTCSLLKLLVIPRLEFFQLYIFKGGFLDGYYGFVICKNSSFASYVKYLKIRLYTKMKKEGKPF